MLASLSDDAKPNTNNASQCWNIGVISEKEKFLKSIKSRLVVWPSVDVAHKSNGAILTGQFEFTHGKEKESSPLTDIVDLHNYGTLVRNIGDELTVELKERFLIN